MEIKFLVTIFILSIVQFLQTARPFIVKVDAHSEECFFEKIEGGTKFSLAFEVVEGGFLDIDTTVTSPVKELMLQSEKASSSRLTFTAFTPGVYAVCFKNQKSSMTPKLVMFSIDVDESSHRQPGAPGEEEIGHTKLKDMISKLSGTLTSVKHEQEYIHARDKIHRSINERTNSRFVLWSNFESLILVLMIIGQVYYLKCFFEVKRVV